MPPRLDRLYRDTGPRLRVASILLLGWVVYAALGVALGLVDLAWFRDAEDAGASALDRRAFRRMYVWMGWIAVLLVTAIPYGRLVRDLLTNAGRLGLRRRTSDWSLTRATRPWGILFVIVVLCAWPVAQRGLQTRAQWDQRTLGEWNPESQWDLGARGERSGVDDLVHATQLDFAADVLIALAAVLMVLVLRRFHADLEQRRDDMLEDLEEPRPQATPR